MPHQIFRNPLTSKRSTEGGTWFHIRIEDAEDAVAVKEAAPFLDDATIAALCANDTRPRVDALGDDLLINLRAVNMNPGAEADDMVSLRLWSDGTNIVSVVRRKIFGVAKLLDTINGKPAAFSAQELIVRILTNIIENMRGPLANLFDVIDSMELNLIDGDHGEQRSQLKSLRYTVLTLRRYIAPMRVAVSELDELAEDWGEPKLTRQIRQAEDNITRHLEDLDMARERLQYQQEEILAAISDRLNRNMYRLSIVAAIFLPLGFLTGLLGINVAGIPAAEVPTAFWWVVGGCASIVLGQLLYFKRGGWF